MMQQDRERSLQNQRIPMETYLGYLGQTAEEFREQLRPTAEDRLTRYLVMRKLAEEENIEVSPEEVEEEIDSLVSSAGDSEEAMRRALSSESAKENVQSSLTDRKVLQRLVQIFQGEEAISQGGPESEQPGASEPDREPPEPSAPDRDVPVADVESLDSTDPEEST